MTILLVDFPSGGRGRYDTNGSYGAGYVQSFYQTGMWLYDDPRPGPEGVGVCWGTGGGTNWYMVVNLPDVQQRFIFSFRMFMYSLPRALSKGPLFRLREDNDGVNMDLNLYPDGSFGNGVPCFVTESWQHVEVMWGAGDDYEGLQIRVDGELVLDSPSGGEIYRPEPPEPPIYIFRIESAGDPDFVMLKDFVLQYDTDAEFLGQGSVRELIPIADVSSGWALTGAATEHEALSNAPPSGTEFISATDPILAPSVTTLGGLPAAAKAIHGLMLTTFLSSPGVSEVQASLVKSGTPRDGGLHVPLTTPRYFSDIFETDPDTGLPWDPAVVAALDLSINRTA